MWPDGLLALAIAGAVATGGAAALHAILYKRDVRAAIGWAGFVLVAPGIGPLLYLLFGVNRIRRSAVALRPVRDRGPGTNPSPGVPEALSGQALLGDRVCGNRLHPGSRIAILDGGAHAFPAMLDAIDSAQTSVLLCSYIFECDPLGRRFIDALAAAAARGADVRVLLDAVGSRIHGHGTLAALHERGVRAALFLPPRLPGGILSINLRNHRKLLVVDGTVAFTGGMNIAEAYETRPGGHEPIRDVQFRVEGPVVADLHATFAADWHFATDERVGGISPPAPIEPGVAARAVADGPDEQFERSRWLILGAIAMARRSILIATPYFLPDMPLINALNTAALRGVTVDIVIPERLDHRVVKWASNALLWQVLEKGCRVWFTPEPFDHSKLFAVDGVWAFFGSTNWDARSLRLNFELNVEVAGEQVACAIADLVEQRRRSGREITLAEMDARPLHVRTRDGLARLFTPYL